MKKERIEITKSNNYIHFYYVCADQRHLMFSQVFWELKRNYEIIEFAPNQIISIHRLERGGITKEDLKEFCDQVYETVEENEYFSAKSLRNSGFYSDLYELGFSDWFYGGILAADPRFSYGKVFSSIILSKSHTEITIKSFLRERIRTHRSIDVYDLMSELEGNFGCEILEKNKVTYAVQGTEIFYDPILERFYANEELYYREIDEAGGRV